MDNERGCAIYVVGVITLVLIIALGAGAFYDGGQPVKPTKTQQVASTGASNIQHAVTANRLRTYFNRHPEFASKCTAYKEKIENGEEGFRLQKYGRYPISHATQQVEYTKTIFQKPDGTYEMKASIRCVYRVTVQVNVFAYAEERVEYDGGKVYFRLGLYQNDGGYHVNRMEAYKHSRE